MTVTRNVLPPSVTRLKTFISPWQPDTTTRGNIIVVVAFFLPENAKAWSNSYTLVVYALLMVRESIDRDQDLKWNRLRSLYTLDSIVDTVVNYLSYPKRSSNQLKLPPFLAFHWSQLLSWTYSCLPTTSTYSGPVILPYRCLRMTARASSQISRTAQRKWNVWNSNRLAQ